jgi:hypothetical protein
MAWLTRTNWSAIDNSPSHTDLNNIGLDIRTWGAGVDAAGNALSNLGNLTFAAAEDKDIGASGATRPRDLFLARNAVVGGSVRVTGAAGTDRALRFQTDQLDRWYMGAANGAESGGNVGSDFFIALCDDAGAYFKTALIISRATGNVGICGEPLGRFTVYGTHAGSSITLTSKDDWLDMIRSTTHLLLETPAGADVIFAPAGTERMRVRNAGGIKISGLPTSSAGLQSGDLWVDVAAGRVVKQVA